MKYEYAEEQELHISEINRFATNGWELVQVVPVVKYNYMFRRVLPELPEIVNPSPLNKVTSVKKYINVDINEFNDWSVRVTNAFFNNKITIVGDLLIKSVRELLKMNNFGKHSLHEVEEALAKHNLEIGMLKPDDQSTQNAL